MKRSTVDHLIRCGGVQLPSRSKASLDLDIGGKSPNVNFEISQIARPLLANVADVLIDLIEIASYVYCADQAITRGGDGVQSVGKYWRRDLSFYIPVRVPDLWSSPRVQALLRDTLGFLSDDEYTFHFSKSHSSKAGQSYFSFSDANVSDNWIDDVVLFSGGLDSLAGAVLESVRDCRKIAFVSHRSNPKIYNKQRKLINQLSDHCKPDRRPFHVAVWLHKEGTLTHEYTQRSRSFLFAALGASVARLFGKNRIKFYENGIVSLNLPISEQVVGGRATRTTHPQVLNGFAGLFSLLFDQTFSVENPFLWDTKTAVVNLIGDHGCANLIKDSVSCTHTRQQTLQHSHCGNCSQCVSRRFSTLASRYAKFDPESIYGNHLLTGARDPGVDLTLLESFVRTATNLGELNEQQIIEGYGEVSRVLRHVAPLSADEVAGKICELHTRHSSEVTGVLDRAISSLASALREGKLPLTCGIVLAVRDRNRFDEPLKAVASPAPPFKKAVSATKPADSPKKGRAAGRPAGAEYNRALAGCMTSFGVDNWSERLPDLCEFLDNENVQLPFSEKWKTKGCSNWTDVAEVDREGLVKALQYRLDWVAQHPE